MDEMFMENKSSINKTIITVEWVVLFDISIDITTNLVYRFSVVRNVKILKQYLSMKPI